LQQAKRNSQQLHQTNTSSTQQPHPGQTSNSNIPNQPTNQFIQPAAPYGPNVGHGQGAQAAPTFGQSSGQGQGAQAQAAQAFGQSSGYGSHPASPYGHIAQGAQSASYGPNVTAPGQSSSAEEYFTQQAQYSSDKVAYNGGAAPFFRPPTNKQNGSIESILVRIVLPIVFIIVLLIGILMLFIAGVAYGLLTEPVRCLLGLLLAIGMYTFGMLQQRFKRPIWGKTLLGGAHGIFIITVSVAHLSYEIIGVLLAALAYALAFGLIIFSAIRWKSQLLVCIAVISGYLCMFLIDISNVHIAAYVIVQLVFSISMLLLCMKLNYRIAFWFAYLLLQFSLLITYNLQEYTSHKLLLAALIIQHLVVFFIFARRKLIYLEHNIVQIIGVIALFSWAAELYNLPGGISLTFALVTITTAILYACALLFFERLLSRTQDQEQEQDEKKIYNFLLLRTEISTIIIAIALLCFFIELLGASFIGLVLLLIGVSLVLYGVRDVHAILRWFGGLLAFVGAVTIIFDYPSKLLSYEILSWIIMLISIPLVYRECRERLTEDVAKPTVLSTLLWIEAILSFIFITILADLIGDYWDSSAGSYIISFAWLLYALGAIILGTVRKLSKARLTGIILMLVIVIKVIFIDITFLNILSKSIIFTVLGGIGILVSFILYNRTDENKQ